MLPTLTLYGFLIKKGCVLFSFFSLCLSASPPLSSLLFSQLHPVECSVTTTGRKLCVEVADLCVSPGEDECKAVTGQLTMYEIVTSRGV